MVNKKRQSFFLTITPSNERPLEDQERLLKLYLPYVQNTQPFMKNQIRWLHMVKEYGSSAKNPHIHMWIQFKEEYGKTRNNFKAMFISNFGKKNFSEKEREYHHKTKPLLKLANRPSVLINSYLIKEDGKKILYSNLSSDKITQLQTDFQNFKIDRAKVKPVHKKFATLNRQEFVQYLAQRVDDTMELDEQPFTKDLFIAQVRALGREYFFINSLREQKSIYLAFKMRFDQDDDNISKILGAEIDYYNLDD